jgi:hypothetical protein
MDICLIVRALAVGFAVWTSSSIGAQSTGSSESAKKPLILVHYMPWYSARPTSPNWGWHWTMNVFDPEK